MEKMLHLLIERGRFSEAVEIAKKARTISIEFSQKIRETILRTRRAPSAVNWALDVAPELSDAKMHVVTRQKEDARMNEAVQNSMATAVEYKVRENLITLRKMIEDASKLRSRLLTDIIKAPEDFLDAHRGLFRSRHSSGTPDLENLMLPEVMKTPIDRLAQISEPTISAFMAAKVRRLFDLSSATQVLMEKKEICLLVPFEDGELVDFDEIVTYFTSIQIEEATGWLAKKLATISRTTSAEILQSAQNEGCTNVVCQCIALLLYQMFGSEDSNKEYEIEPIHERFCLQFASGQLFQVARIEEQ